ncbi:nucleoplasmin-like protein isoform X2 [Anabrus simplex]|uniref:nucleoplasmin-like protein isoform X2 n=1 Tax=Anabrus simplex TaxID=316456 RepID=UPI0034DD8E57
MAEEYFWGLTLSAGDASTGSWDPENDNTDPNRPIAYQGDQTLVIKQAVLGADAKVGELNVVQVEAMGFNGSVKLPVLRLQLPETPQCQLDLSFPDPPVAFTLIKGSGPISLIGNIGIGHVGGDEEDIDEDIDEEEDENLEEEDEDSIPNAKGDKKRKMPLNSSGKMKKAKVEDINDAEGDDDDYDDEDDDPKKKKGVGAKDKKEKQKKKK